MIELHIKELVAYAKAHLFLKEEDALYATNMLLGYFHCDAPTEQASPLDIEALATPDPIVEGLLEDLIEQGLTPGEAERKVVFALGALSPRPSAVQDAFDALCEIDPAEATEYLYDLSVHNYYVRKTMIDKNIVFDAHFEQGSDLEVSINLSKPEKKNSDIAKLLTVKSTSYPPCLLCPENLGFYGHDRHPARGNLRYVEMTLEGKTWYLQFSPYGYFDRHCILLQKEHVPMEVSVSVFATLLSFVERFPHYFMGSNADLPIVGGSILNHEHFQGGRHLLPIMRTGVKEVIPTSNPDVELAVLDFYATSLRVSGKDKEEVLAFADSILTAWRSYDDPENGILHESEGKPHNTITAIARKEGELYRLYMILRNNRCTKDFPDGLFHVNPSRMHIKSEGIGLIEASGLFILPARLKRQGAEVVDVVQNKLSDEQAKAKYEDIEPFLGMAHQMAERNQSLEGYLGEVCQNILRDVAVFKDNPKGQRGLHHFLEGIKL